MRDSARDADDRPCLDRRSLFRIAGLGMPALALTAAPSAAEEIDETGSAGLRSTAHVQAYLASARL